MSRLTLTDATISHAKPRQRTSQHVTTTTHVQDMRIRATVQASGRLDAPSKGGGLAHAVRSRARPSCADAPRRAPAPPVLFAGRRAASPPTRLLLLWCVPPAPSSVRLGGPCVVSRAPSHSESESGGRCPLVRCSHWCSYAAAPSVPPGSRSTPVRAPCAPGGLPIFIGPPGLPIWAALALRLCVGQLRGPASTSNLLPASMHKKPPG